MTHRVIARLDIKGRKLVKGIHLEGLRVLGNPDDFARFYYEQGIDELMYQDVVASLYQRNSLRGNIETTARDIFIPLTVGGGLRSIDDIRQVLLAGADKVALNTAVLAKPGLIDEAARTFGSSTVVVAIEAISHEDNRYYAYTDNGREHTGAEVLSWAKEAQERGAGEIFLTSVDREGTGEGFDLGLVGSVANAVAIPVIAHGGAATYDHVSEAITDAQADAVAVASMLHYGAARTLADSVRDDGEGNREFILSGMDYKEFGDCTLEGLKNHLIDAGVPCRPAQRADDG